MSRIQRTLFLALGTLFALLLAGQTRVEAQTPSVHLACLRTRTSTVSVPLTITNYNRTVSVPRFDPALGTLVSVQFYMNGTIPTRPKVESTDLRPTTISITRFSRLALRRPNNTELVAVAPPLTLAFDAAPYDGTLDYGGTSGKDFGDISTSQSSTSGALTSATDLTLFTGATPLSLPAVATTTYLVTSTGSRNVNLTTQAGASIDVVYTYIACEKISGTVYHEPLLVDGVPQAGEPGLPGITITVTGDTDGDGDRETLSTTTDANGNYSFDHLYPGSYVVEEQVPTGYCVTPRTPTLFNVTATTPNQTYSPYNFFLYTPIGSIGDVIWYDINKNGVQDAGEPGIAGVTITLKDGTGHILASTVTDLTGHYMFERLAANDYRVCVDANTLPAGLTLPTFDRDSGGDSEAAVALGINQTILDGDFGYTGTGSIGDRIWNDINGDGVQGGGEVGINGVTVYLIGTGPDGQLDTADDLAYANQVTSGDGEYLFTSLPAGLYRVRVLANSLPATFTQTFDSDGIGTSNLAEYSLGAGENSRAQDFGYQPHNSSLSGTVFCDNDGNGAQDSGEPGISGVTVTLKDSGGNIITTQDTIAGGGYSFQNLAPGVYKVCSPLTAGGKSPSAPTEATVPLGPNEDKKDVNFGYKPGSISGTVFSDDNGNGLQDSGEPGISGVIVTLAGTDVNGIAANRTVTTDASGGYKFAGLAAGAYTVTVPPITDGKALSTPGSETISLTAGMNKEGVASGYKPGSISGRASSIENEQGIPGVLITLTGTDVNGNPVNRTETTDANGNYQFDKVIAGNYTLAAPATADGKNLAANSPLTAVLAPGENRTAVDFGYRQPVTNNATLVGKLYCDDNGNCNQDTGEPGLPGVIVTLKDANGSVLRTTTTDANGDYEFTGLAGGTYRVCVPHPANGFALVSPNNVSVTVASGGTSRQNFCYKGGVITGYLYCNRNDNGVLDDNEPGLANVPVQLKDENGNVLMTTMTDSNGYYRFSSCLRAGCYIVTAPEIVGNEQVRDTNTLRVCIEPGEVSNANNIGYIERGNGATRASGYWKTHLRAMKAAVGRHGIDLGVLQAGTTPNGSQNLTNPTIGDVTALFWASDTHQGGVRRTALGQARMKLANHLIAAMANVCLFGTSTAQKGFSPMLLADARAALDGTNVNLINSFIEALERFNNSGDNVPLNSTQAQIIGSTDPQGAQKVANRDNHGDIDPGPAFR